MTLTKCDRCGMVLNNVSIYYTITIVPESKFIDQETGVDGGRVDLCIDCQTRFRTFMDGI